MLFLARRLSGSINYGVVIANGIREIAPQFGWDLVIDDVVIQPVQDWGPSLVKVRDVKPAIVATTHGIPEDQTGIVIQFAENPTQSLMYIQYALQLRSYLDIVKEAGHGVFSSTTIGALQDEIGKAFAKKIIGKYGRDATPSVGGQVYDSVFTWAIAACRANGTGVPYDGIEQNKKVCDFLRNQIYRAVWWEPFASCPTSSRRPRTRRRPTIQASVCRPTSCSVRSGKMMWNWWARTPMRRRSG